MKKKSLLVIVLAMIVVPWSASADVIYDNGMPDGGSAWYNDSSNMWRRNADDFILESGASTIKGIHWWGVYYAANQPVPNHFRVSIYGTAAGAYLPGNPILQTLSSYSISGVDSGLDLISGHDIYYYSISFSSPINLNSGTTYWLEILNDTTPDFAEWAWATSRYLDGTHAQSDGIGWQTEYAELAFKLTDDSSSVPEPSTVLLVGLGLMSLAGVRRKRKG